MRIELNLRPGRQQRLFLDYLNSALRNRTASYSGSAGLTSDNLFQSSVTGPFPVDTERVQLTWRVVKSPDGTLLYLEVLADETQVHEAKWTTAVHELVHSVFANTLAENRRPFFRRHFFLYIGPQLDGEYWLGGYRFAPALPDDGEPFAINAERAVSIDMIVQGIDEDDARVIASEAARRHAARLSLLLNVGLYTHASEMCWVLPKIDGRTAERSERCQLLFFHPSAQLTRMPAKGEVCPLGQYKGSLAARYRVAGHLLSLPPEARRILNRVDLASPAVSDAFDRGARLYQVATVVERSFPSVGLAYRVAAVEAISRADPQGPDFSVFMRRHVRAGPDIDAVLDYLYGAVRSAHFHSGEFPLGEFTATRFFDPLMDSEVVQRSALHRLCYEVTRKAVVNWIISLLPEPDTSGQDAE